MPVFRDENGDIVETPVGEIRRKSASPKRAGGEKTRAVQSNLPPVHGADPAPNTKGKTSNSNDKTQRYSPNNTSKPKPSTASEAASEAASTKTRLVKGRSKNETPDEAPPSSDDPTVGWVVIKSGPGQGRSFEIGYGNNDVGRSPDSRVKLDFGDKSMSRSGHCSIVYDPMGRTFYVQPGSGKNLTYLRGAPVLNPEKITSHDEISLGDTVLIFVSLCGEAFDWQDAE